MRYFAFAGRNGCNGWDSMLLVFIYKSQLDNKTTCQHVVVANLKVYIINTTDLFSLLDVLIQLIFLSLSSTKKSINKN